MKPPNLGLPKWGFGEVALKQSPMILSFHIKYPLLARFVGFRNNMEVHRACGSEQCDNRSVLHWHALELVQRIEDCIQLLRLLLRIEY